MGERIIPNLEQIIVPADSLDRAQFYEQHSEAIGRALAAVDDGDTQAVADSFSQLDFLRDTNPVLSHEIRTRWESNDIDL